MSASVPAARAASHIRAVSTASIAIGFSHSTAFPAASAPTAISACVTGGVTMLTKSTSGCATTSRQSDATDGIPNSRATASAFSRRPLATATRRAPATQAHAGNCVVRANPVPTMPTPTVLSISTCLCYAEIFPSVLGTCGCATLQQTPSVPEFPRSLAAVTVRTANVTLFDFSLDCSPGVPPFYHLGNSESFGGVVAVVKLKHYGIRLAAIDARMFTKVVKDFLSLFVFQPLIETPQLFPVML